MESRLGLTHDLRRTRKSAGHGPESIIEDVNVTNFSRNVTSHIGTSGQRAKRLECRCRLDNPK
jgi:hypothetical protein